MSVAANVHDLREVEAFYKRWGPDVFVFCRLFLGDEPQAEALCSKAFLQFYRECRELPLTGEVPPRLVGSALQAMQPCRDGTASSPAERLFRRVHSSFGLQTKVGVYRPECARHDVVRDRNRNEFLPGRSAAVLVERNASSA